MVDDRLLKIADVLEKAAAVLDEQEAVKQAAVKQAQDATVKALTEQYASLTGEDLPTEVAEKLASSDPTIVTAVRKLMSKTASTGPESMGGSSDVATPQSRPTTKKEALDAANQRFLNFIAS